jgi:hypothetical protein
MSDDQARKLVVPGVSKEKMVPVVQPEVVVRKLVVPPVNGADEGEPDDVRSPSKTERHVDIEAIGP